ncbi:MAG: hypothetical protein ABIG89_06860 [Candidatus Woesearchaeota archaeon]
MKFNTISKLFVVLMLFLISVMAVNAADFSANIYNMYIEVGANDGNVHTNDEENIYCRYKISISDDLKTKGSFAFVKTTWTVGTFDYTSYEVKKLFNDINSENKIRLTQSPNWNTNKIDFKVNDNVKCKVEFHWENPDKKEGEPEKVDKSSELSVNVKNTVPKLDFGAEDDFKTVVEGTSSVKWEGTGTVKSKISDIDSEQTFTFTATSSHPNDFSCSVENDNTELTATLTNSNFNTDSGDAYCELKVNDGVSDSNTDKVYLHITNDNADDITITSTAVTTATIDVEYGYQVTASNPDNLLLDCVLDTAPAWLKVKEETKTGCKLYGTPSEAKTETVVLTIKSNAQEKKQSFSIVVSNPSAPSFNVGDQIVQFGNSLTVDFTSASYLSNPSGLPVTFLEATGMPVSIAFTGSGLQGTPTEAEKGSYPIIVKGKYTVSNKDTEFIDSFNLNVKGPSCIVINDIKAYAGENGDNKDSGVDENGGTIDKVQPGDKLKFVVEVKNICEEEGTIDHEVEDIEVTFTLEEMSDEGDEDEDESLKDLRVNKKDEVTFTKNVPDDASEDTYLATFKAIGYDKDTNDKYETDVVSVNVQVEKDDNNLKFKTFTLNPSTISCTKNTQLSLKLMNIGSNDEDDVQLVISNSELKIEEIDLIDSLQEGDADDSDTYFTKNYNFQIPSNAEAKPYVITGKAYYDDGKTETATAILTVAECGDSSSTSTGSSTSTTTTDSTAKKDTVEVITTTSPVTSTSTQTATAQPAGSDDSNDSGSFFESTLYVGLLIAAIVVVLLVIIGLIVAVSRR